MHYDDKTRLKLLYGSVALCPLPILAPSGVTLAISMS